MKFENVLKKVRDKASAVDVSKIKGLVAVQVTLTEQDAGVFYIEVKDGVLSIEPYEYIDRQANIIMSNENFCKLMNGKLDPVIALPLGKIKVEGDISKALEISKLVK